jgi:peptidoglycan/LPS O-acetylase OafA/YrhL
MQKKRLDSLDALRGFDMFWIIGGEAFIIHGQRILIGHPSFGCPPSYIIVIGMDSLFMIVFFLFHLHCRLFDAFKF